MVFIVIFFPLIVSVILYFVSFLIGYDFGYLIYYFFMLLGFSGVEYVDRGLLTSVSYGSLFVSIVFSVPYFFFVYRILDVKRVLRSGLRIDMKKTLLSSFFVFFVLISAFFVDAEYYSNRGWRVVDTIFSSGLLVYLFLVFPSQFLIGLWALSLKIKLNK